MVQVEDEVTNKGQEGYTEKWEYSKNTQTYKEMDQHATLSSKARLSD